MELFLSYKKTKLISKQEVHKPGQFLEDPECVTVEKNKKTKKNTGGGNKHHGQIHAAVEAESVLIFYILTLWILSHCFRYS